MSFIRVSTVFTCTSIYTCMQIYTHSPLPCYTGIAQIARVCLQLRELDMGGCLAISDKSLCSLQDSILHIRSPQHRYFTLIAGGTHVHNSCPHCLSSYTCFHVVVFWVCGESWLAIFNPPPQFSRLGIQVSHRLYFSLICI